jgi:UDP-GlcNAc:undecaprenyl-phosphate GlcNAc-1-phosphate transferase
MIPIYNFFISFILTLILVPLFRKIGIKYKILDYPDKRKIHNVAVPRSGGIAMVSVFIIIIIFNILLKTVLLEIFLKIIWAFIILVFLGIYDDLKNINPRIKLLFQIIVASIIYFNGIKIFRISNPLGGEIYLAGTISFIFTVIWVVGLINAINFIDGMDGLAAGTILISNIFLSIISLTSKNYLVLNLSIILIGICVGFLFYNFPPAKIFMGDTGSMFLGFIMATISIIGNRKGEVGITLLIPIILLLLPIFDTLSAIFRRIKSKKSIFKPDRKHIHHKLLEVGITYKNVLYLLYLINIYLGLIALLSLKLPREYLFLIFIILGIGVLIFFEFLKILEKIKNE